MSRKVLRSSDVEEFNNADYIAIGKYVKRADPEIVVGLKRDGYQTDAASVGRYYASIYDAQDCLEILYYMGRRKLVRV